MIHSPDQQGHAWFALPKVAFVGAGLSLALLWVFWPTFVQLSDRWQEAHYSHGWLVPFFSLYLLLAPKDPSVLGKLRFSRRGIATFFRRLSRWVLSSLEMSCPSWWGWPVLLAGLGLHFAGIFYYYTWFEAVSFLPCLAGIFVLLGGWTALRWSWPAIAFLMFMVPLPFTLETAFGLYLRHLATVASTYCLQTLGFPAFAQGNLIYGLSRKPIGVEEACSGLGMLVIFLALSTAVAIVVRRPMLDRIIILLSAVPIALAANIVRITVTGILYKTVGSDLADKFFHGPAGWLMMPLALGFLWGELKVLSWVLVAPPEKEAVGLDFDENIRFPKRREGRRVEGEGPATRDEGQGVKDEGRAASDSSTPTPHPSPLAPHPSSLIPETRPEKDDTFPSPGLHA